MDRNEPILEIRGLRKSYGQGPQTQLVLKSIDLSIKRGEMLAILGPSGSGKSTLLHILGLMDRPTNGDIRFLGSDIKTTSEQAQAELRNKKLGFVFQFDSLLPDFSVLENVCLPHWISNPSFQDRLQVAARAEKTLSDFKMLPLAQRLPRELSGGERQRAAIARALINQPAMVLADEPTGNLDRHNGELVFNTLRDIVDQFGVTVVVVTHNEGISQFATRVVHLRDGMLALETARK